MLRLELDIGRMLKAFVLTFFSLLLMASPFTVHAQALEPTPIPLRPSSQELQILDSISKHLETMSASSDTTANASTLLLGGAFFVLMLIILIIVVWIARGGLNRVWDIITTERQRANSAEQSETTMRIQYDERDRQAAEYRTRTAEAQDRTAAAQERMANVLKEIPNREEAAKTQLAIQDTSNAARDVINTHVDEAASTINEHTNTKVDALDKKLDGVIETLEEAKRAAITQEKFDNTINPLVLKIEEAIKEMRAMKAPDMPAPP